MRASLARPLVTATTVTMPAASSAGRSTKTTARFHSNVRTDRCRPGQAPTPTSFQHAYPEFRSRPPRAGAAGGTSQVLPRVAHRRPAHRHRDALHVGHDHAVRDRAVAALDVIRAPAFIGLDAVRTTLQICAMLYRIPAERCEFLVAALGTGAPARAGCHVIGTWYRNTDDRWLLTVTPRDMALGARTARASPVVGQVTPGHLAFHTWHRAARRQPPGRACGPRAWAKTTPPSSARS